ncbi:MAG TPA: Fic family protein [Candidatus Angelobacter sp.]|nr:Fic family protein [Candidatus Angelobacter sp.]
MEWLKFEFDYRLDLQRLTPHVLAVEGQKHAALTRVLPPQWRKPAAELAQTEEENAEEQSRITNAANAQAWVNERFAPGKGQLCLTDLMTMHRMVADGATGDYVPGALRSLAVQVGRREVGGLHMGAPANWLPRLMGQYIQFITGERLLGLHPVIHALIAHFFLVTIHPFGDGNGRVSRLLTAGILLQRGYNVHGGFYALSDYFYLNDVKYHSILHSCWKSPPFDLTPFVAFGMEGFVMELRSISSFMKMKLSRVVDRDILLQFHFGSSRRTTRRARLARLVSR